MQWLDQKGATLGFLKIPGIGVRGRIPPQRAVFALAIGAVVAIVVGAVLLLWDLYDREIRHAEGEIVSLSRILSEQTTRALDGIDLVLNGVQDRLADTIGQQLPLDSTIVHLLLHARTTGMPQLASVFVVDVNGNVMNTSRGPNVARHSVADREYFSTWVQGNGAQFFFGRPTHNRINGKWTLHISRPLYTVKGDFRGVVVADIDLEYFESIYGSIKLDYANPISLFLRDGTLVVRHPRGDAAIGSQVVDLDGFTQQDGDSNYLMSYQQPGWISAYRPVSKYPLAIGVAVEKYEMLENWRGDAWRISLGGLFGALMIILAAWQMARELRKEEALLVALRESEERLVATVATLSDAVLTVNGKGEIVLFNHAAECLFMCSAQAVIGTQCCQVLPPAFAELLVGTEKLIIHGENSPVLLELACAGQSVLPLEASLSRSAAGEDFLLTLVLRDVSERQAAEVRLRESHQQLRELSASLQQVREAERARIARELHDELGQKLTGLKLEISWLAGQVKKMQPELAGKMDDMKQLLGDTIEETRRIASELRPLMLDDLGFAAAAEWMAQGFARRCGLRVDLDLQGADDVTGDPLATVLFRVLQESLTNVVRHAQATAVNVSLLRSGATLIMRIEDDGRGLPHELRVGGFGLLGMRERVLAVGGSISVVNAPAGGVCVELSVPLGEGGHS